MSNRTLDSDWSWDQDQYLLAARDEHPTPSYSEIGRRMTRRFGVYRTHAACLGRFARILKESEEALAAAQRHVRRKTYQDRVREVGDPYHPLPEWFREPTPVETNQARLKAYDDDQRFRAGGGQQSVQARERDEHNAQIARDIITGKFDRRVEQVRLASQKRIAKTREAKTREARTREAKQAKEVERRTALPAHDSSLYLGIQSEVVQSRPVRRRQPQKAVGLDKVAAEALPEQDETLVVVSVPRAASRHYRPSWTD